MWFSALFFNPKQELSDSVLQQRAYDMIINEPGNVKHRLMYAIMAIRLKGEKDLHSSFQELVKYVEDAKACDPKESKVTVPLDKVSRKADNRFQVFSLLGFLHEKIGQTEKAKQYYLAGYNNVYAVGGRLLSIADVELLALFAAFSEMHG